MASKPPKFCDLQIFLLTKYQLSIFLCLLFAEKIKFLIGQSTKIFSVKTGFEELKKSKQNFGGLDAMNELFDLISLPFQLR